MWEWNIIIYNFCIENSDDHSPTRRSSAPELRCVLVLYGQSALLLLGKFEFVSFSVIYVYNTIQQNLILFPFLRKKNPAGIITEADEMTLLTVDCASKSKRMPLETKEKTNPKKSLIVTYYIFFLLSIVL